MNAKMNQILFHLLAHSIQTIFQRILALYWRRTEFAICVGERLAAMIFLEQRLKITARRLVIIATVR